MWRAIYKEGSTLEQFEKDKEHLFKEINQKKLVIFEIQLNGKIYHVSLIDGSFRLNNEIIKFDSLNKKFKLIYFRRVRNTLGPAGGGATTTHHLGWQIEGNKKEPNQQRIMKISEEGPITFEVK